MLRRVHKMPSKESLLSTYSSSEEMLKAVSVSLDVCETLVFVKKVGGQAVVRCALNSDSNVQFDGSGVSKKEAIADAISKKFPN